MTSPLPDNVAGALAYFTILPATLFLVVEPYNSNRFVRFHAFQCLFLHLAALVIALAMGTVVAVMMFIPLVRILVPVIIAIVVLAALTLWLLMVVKAYQNEIYKLPVIGDMAEKHAGA